MIIVYIKPPDAIDKRLFALRSEVAKWDYILRKEDFLSWLSNTVTLSFQKLSGTMCRK